MRTHFFYTIVTALFLSGCGVNPKNYDNGLDFALASKNKKISRVMDQLDHHQIQILYTRVKKNEKGPVHFDSYQFQVDSSKYFYPASSVKIIAAALALEALEERALSHETVYQVGGEKQQQSFSKDIQEIFAISSNETYNRLFDFLGTDHINKQLTNKGIASTRISHRLSTSDAANPKTRDLKINNPAGGWSQQYGFMNQATYPLELSAIKKGKGYIENGIQVTQAFDFSLKNHFPIQSQQALLKRLVFPALFEPHETFELGEEKRNFLLKSMSSVPKEMGYHTVEYYDSYGKFFMYGDTKKPIPDHIKIYNKVGYAYGTLTDNAFIKDSKNNISFMLTATILVNKNGIFNDNIYEYESIGIPFLAQLGREIYTYEKYLKKIETH